jgi:hypothetical protein
MPTIEVDVEVWCAECGAGLCNQTTVESSSRKRGLHVMPCKRCSERIKEEGFNEGFAEAESRRE